MERYTAIKAELLPTIRVCFENIRQIDHSTKIFDITLNDLVSVLYIDKLSEIGENKEYQINGRIIDISKKEIHKASCMKDSYQYMITIDSSTEYETKQKKLYLSNILDIHEYPYRYELVEHPKVLPDPLTEKFIVHELTHPQDVDMTVPNDPILGHYEYDGGDDNE